MNYGMTLKNWLQQHVSRNHHDIKYTGNIGKKNYTGGTESSEITDVAASLARRDHYSKIKIRTSLCNKDH